jgi:hypothetical protein
MHTFIYPSQNSYITNENGYENSNFSLDSTLEIKSVNSFVPTVTLYVTQSISGSTPCNIQIFGFSGQFFGGLNGIISNFVGNIVATGSFITNNFTGTYTGSLVSNYSGSIIGSASGSILGYFSGSINNDANSYLSGSLTGLTGSMYSGSIYNGITNVYNPTPSYTILSTISRTLMQFDLTSISQSILNGNIVNTSSLKYYINLKNSEANEIPLNYTIYAYPLITPWKVGDGRYQLGGSANGVSWNYTDYYNGTSWTKYGGDYVTSGSYSASQTFNNASSDIKMDITNMVNGWIGGGITNNGLILITSLESSSYSSNNSLEFFGTQTNTIYSPYLDVSWDDSVYTTGSMPNLVYPYTIVLQNLKAEYKFGSIPKIHVFARPQTPLKNFIKGIQSNYYLTSSYLPSASYFMIKDNESEEVIMDFDEGTKLSCDGYTNYFEFDTTALPQERYFRIIVKVYDFNGAVDIFDNKNIFKVVR